MIRIYIDTNDMDSDGWCHLLRYKGRTLDDAAVELGLKEGMPVVLYNEEAGEEFEFDGAVYFRDGRWLAKADRDSYRLISEANLDELRKQPWFKWGGTP
jgi:hypothetical protein